MLYNFFLEFEYRIAFEFRMRKFFSKGSNLFAFFVILILFFKLLITFDFLRTKISKSNSLPQTDFVENHEFIYNNNIAQYSSYLIVEKIESNSCFYRIEVLIVRSRKNINIFKNDFACVLKYSKNHKLEIVQINIDKPYLSHYNESKKLSFKLNLNLFKSYLKDPYDFDVNCIVLAVIQKSDFYMKDAHNKHNETKDFEDSIVLPFSLITYQKPTIIKINEPRLPLVGLCVQHTYQILSFLRLKNWIDYHLTFGIGEIRFYDSVEKQNLTQFIENTYGKDGRLTVLPYKKEMNIANMSDYQKSRFDREIFFLADDITSNDCLTVLRYKHEFVALYDLDEFIFPRSLENYIDFHENKSNFRCENKNSICPFNPIASKHRSYFYDYLNSLIERERNGRDRKKLRSIDFRRTIALKHSDESTILIMKELKRLIQTINSSQVNSYPLELFIRMNKKEILGYKFLIEETDVDYVKHVYKSYENLISCGYNEYLNDLIKNNSVLDRNFVRFLYFVTEYTITNYKNYKKIHYYKNVNTLFTHWAVDYEADIWTFIPSPGNGHVIHHFRGKFLESRKNFTDSIRLLNIDYDYLFFVLKKYSNFC